MKIELKDVDEIDMYYFLRELFKATVCGNDSLNDFNEVLNNWSLPYYGDRDGEEFFLYKK